MTQGFPVVITEGSGIPVIPVEKGAPLASVAANGLGAPIRIVDKLGVPMIVDGLVRPWWRDPFYSIPAFDGGDLGAGLAADFRRARYALPMGMTPAQILTATHAEIAAAMRSCAFSDVFEFLRASAATDIVDGRVVTFAANAPRRSAANGALLEGPATNLCAQSENFDTWAKAGVSVLPADNSPAGGACSHLVFDAGATAALDRLVHAATGATSGAMLWTTSIFLKAAGRDAVYFGLSAHDSSGPTITRMYCSLNLSTGTAVLTGGGFVNPQYRIEPLTNGWWRIALAGTPPANTGYCRLDIGNPSPGDGVTGVYAYGAQLEAGAVASSYIPTAGTAATRAADSCKLTARAAAVLQRISAGLLVQGNRLMRPSKSAYAPIIGGAGGFRVCGMSGDSKPVVGNSAVITIGGAVLEPWPGFGFAVGWDAGGKAGAIYGQFAADAVPLDANRDSIYLGRAATFTNLGGYYHQLVAWPGRPANAALPGKAIPYA